MCVCCTEDKKGGVDRSSTVIAKEPEGKANSRDGETFPGVSTSLLLCTKYVKVRYYASRASYTLRTSRDRETGLSHPRSLVLIRDRAF